MVHKTETQELKQEWLALGVQIIYVNANAELLCQVRACKLRLEHHVYGPATSALMGKRMEQGKPSSVKC